jgi:hypothetical protein
MTRSIVDPSLFQIDPRYTGVFAYKALNGVKPLLLPLLGILCLFEVLLTRLSGDVTQRKLRWFALGLAGVVAFSVVLHWLAFHFAKLPLPKARTGVYLVPLVTLLAGLIASAPSGSAVSKWVRGGLRTVFICLACYFLLCLRLTYFEEWRWDADVKDVYPVLARYNHTYHVNDVGMTWWYVSSLNFYRVVSGAETFPEFAAPTAEPPSDKSIYVLHGLFDRGFLDKERLVVVYRGKSTDVVVAVKLGGPIPAIGIDQ